MKIIVEKYGGSSLATPQQIQNIARGIVESHDPSYGLVVVVSAMGHTTDELLALAKQFSATPPARELAMLLATGEMVSSALLTMALQTLGKKAVALNGIQAGFHASGSYESAYIVKIDTQRIHAHLRNGEIVVVTGYQGLRDDDIAVLGRGGSDASAVALAAELEAERCAIYSDVIGVYSADPRLVLNAVLLPVISYEEMIEIAAAGANVMMGRAVEIARWFNLQIYLGLSIDRRLGTLLTKRTDTMEHIEIRSFAIRENIAIVKIETAVNRFTWLSDHLSTLAGGSNKLRIFSCEKTNCDKIAVTLAISEDDAASVVDQLQSLPEVAVGFYQKGLSQITAVGHGITTSYGIFHDLVVALNLLEVEIVASSVSDLKISFVIPEEKARFALNVLHDRFVLKRPGVNDKSRSDRRVTIPEIEHAKA